MAMPGDFKDYMSCPYSNFTEKSLNGQVLIIRDLYDYVETHFVRVFQNFRVIFQRQKIIEIVGRHLLYKDYYILPQKEIGLF